MKSYRLRVATLLAMSLVLVTACAPAVSAMNHVGNSYFRGTPNGNFTFISANYRSSNSIKGSVLPNWESTDTSSGGGAVGTDALGIVGTDSNYDKKLKFFNFLKKKNEGVGVTDTEAKEWERMGSALMVHQLLGRPQVASGWGDAARTIIDPDEWDELKARLLDDNIYMDRGWVSQVDNENTSGIKVGSGYTVYDAIRYNYDQSDVDAGWIDEYVDSWIFREGVGAAAVIRYQVEIICANPLGRLGGLPPVPQDYSLTPTASVDKSVVEPDDSATVTNTVENGSTVDSDPTNWRLTQMVFVPGTTLSVPNKAGRDHANDACSAFPSGGRSSCSVVQENTTEVFDAGATKAFDPVFTYNVPPGTVVGTRICFTASVSRPTQDANPVWRHSALQCIIVGKKPKVQVWGGDVRAGTGIDTSINTFTSLGRTYGSWGEYAALSNGPITGFASGAGLNEGGTSSNQVSWSRLTFANPNAGGCPFGCYGFTPYGPSLTGQFVSSSSNTLLSGSRDLSAVGDGTYRAGNLTITGGAIGSGKTIVIVATGTVRITGNITYSDGPYTNVEDIPQVVIKAASINIAGSVGNIDAWLIATNAAGTGALNTCSDVAVSAQLTSAICSGSLTVNGPVVANRIYLRRTAGSGGAAADRDRPAEIFNLRADAYVWGSAYGTETGKIRTVHTKELPPRF